LFWGGHFLDIKGALLGGSFNCHQSGFPSPVNSSEFLVLQAVQRIIVYFFNVMAHSNNLFTGNSISVFKEVVQLLFAVIIE